MPIIDHHNYPNCQKLVGTAFNYKNISTSCKLQLKGKQLFNSPTLFASYEQGHESHSSWSTGVRSWIGKKPIHHCAFDELPRPKCWRRQSTAKQVSLQDACKSSCLTQKSVCDWKNQKKISRSIWQKAMLF